MAVHVNDVKLLTNPSMDGVEVMPGAVVSYTLDSVADVISLPVMEILPGSSAFIPSTGQVFSLDGNGWQQI